MTCEIFKRLPGGETFTICVRDDDEAPACSVSNCGQPAHFLCDYPLASGTCDRPLCANCRTVQPIPPPPQFTCARMSDYSPSTAEKFGDREMGMIVRVDTLDYCPKHDAIASKTKLAKPMLVIR